MNILRNVAALSLLVGLSACGGMDVPTRNSPLESTAGIGAVVQSARPAVAQPVRVTALTVSVPQSLKVSEANVYYPAGDIVWRGEPRGDRHAQVGAIFEESLRAASTGLTGGRDVTAEIQVKRFHALTEKTRYSVGGVHAIRFDLTLRDAQTGVVIDGPREIRADLKAYGGERALAAEAQGLTQRVRITRHLANVIASELRQPGTAPSGITERVAGLETAKQN